jgi:hypothetical protein
MNHTGTVIDINDPENLGRVCIELDLQGPAGIKDHQWVYCAQPHSAGQNRPAGRFPGHNYTPGAKVRCTQVDDKAGVSQLLVTDSIPGIDNDKSRKTRDTPEQGSFPWTPWFNPPIDKAANELRDTIKGYENGLYGITSKEALNFNNILNAFIPTKGSGNPVKRNNARQPNTVDEKPNAGRPSQQKDIPQTIGSLKTALTKELLKNPSKYIKDKLGAAGFQMAKTAEQFEALASAVKSGSPVNSIAAVGGINNILQSLASIGQIGSNKLNDADDNLEDYFCQIYEELFPGVDCRKLDGTFTELFLAWKKAYLLLLNGIT